MRRCRRLQTNDALRAKQLGEWRNIIVQWHEARKEATMHVADWPLWENKDIGRRMSAEGIAAVMRFVKEGGNCEWVDAAKTTARIFYKTPSQWAAAVHEYVDGAGLAGTMCIVYDLISGDTTTDAREPRGMRLPALCGAVLLKRLWALLAGDSAVVAATVPAGDGGANGPQPAPFRPCLALVLAGARPECSSPLVGACTRPVELAAAFYGLDAATMIRALDVLEAEGKAEVFRQEALDETGVKFKPRS